MFSGMFHFFSSKINFVGWHKPHSQLEKTYIGYINRIQQKNIGYFFIFLWRVDKTPHPSPPDQKPSNAPIFVHSTAGVHCPKEKPARGGWVIFDKRQKGVRGANARWGDDRLRGGGRRIEWQRQCKGGRCNNQPGQIRGRRNKRQQDNQTTRWKAMAHQEVVVWQEAMRQPTGQGEAKARQKVAALAKAMAEQWQRWVRQQ